MKSAMRAGYLDFVVNTLDEALRTLKNEIRQKRPLSVGLIADVEATLTEMVERGVQPDLQLVPAGCPNLYNPQLQTLRTRGMPYKLTLGSEDNVDGRPIRPMLVLYRKRHYEAFFPAPDAARLREIDARLLALLPAEDGVRRRWIERISSYLRDARTGGRWMWLSEEEQEQIGE
jgi:urocanate hydratase